MSRGAALPLDERGQIPGQLDLYEVLRLNLETSDDTDQQLHAASEIPQGPDSGTGARDRAAGAHLRAREEDDMVAAQGRARGDLGVLAMPSTSRIAARPGGGDPGAMTFDNSKEPTPNEEARAEDGYQLADPEPPRPQLRGHDWPYTLYDLVVDRSRR